MTTTERARSADDLDAFASRLDALVPRWSTRPALGYLPGLDGIRAVSVLAVIAYHLDYTWAAGGYLGVEVFFVLSGFLITRLLLDEEWRTGTIDRGHFWLRRARRLLPAVVVLVVAVWIWAVLVLPDGEAARFRGDAFASLFYVQNWYAIIADQPYFASFGRPSPLRHLWSLAIEEQFYLLWPLFLPTSLKRWGRRRTGVIVAVLAVVSILLMNATADIAAPERAYYGTDTRAFGILLGALLAFGWTPERLRPERLRRAIAAPARWMIDAAGLGALVMLCWQFSHRSEFDPWTYPQGILLVDLCTIVLLVSATHPASSMRRLLGSRVPAAIGRRSYSLYLWHWPVIVFTRPGEDWGLDGTAALCVRLALIAGLSELSYRFVEQPFRDGRVQRVAGAFRMRVGPVAARRTAIVGATIGVFALITLLATPSPAQQVETARAPLATTTTDTTAPPTTAPGPTETTAAPTTTAPTTTAPASPAVSIPPPPASGPHLTVIGESVTLGAVGTLDAHYGARMHLDAREGRRASESLALVSQLASENRLTPTVVLHVGNNGAISSSSFDTVWETVGPDRLLILVKVRVPTRWEGQVNGEIDRMASMHPNVAIADWHAIATNEPGLLTDDGVHLTPAGRQRYTQMLTDLHP